MNQVSQDIYSIHEGHGYEKDLQIWVSPMFCLRGVSLLFSIQGSLQELWAFGGKRQKVKNLAFWVLSVPRINATHLLVIKSLAKYHATAGCKEKNINGRRITQEGFWTTNLQIHKTGCQTKEFNHYYTVSWCYLSSNLHLWTQCIANRLWIDFVVIGHCHIRKFDVLYS